MVIYMVICMRVKFRCLVQTDFLEVIMRVKIFQRKIQLIVNYLRLFLMAVI